MADRPLRIRDTAVRTSSPVANGVLCVVTLGIAGAVAHGRINGQLARLGRARGAMPFPFIKVTPSTAVLAWAAGVLSWCGCAIGIGFYVYSLFDGYEPAAADITSFAGAALFLAPLWLTALHTARRLRTAQHMVGLDRPLQDPWRIAVASCLLPPVGGAMTQAEANRAWRAGGEPT